MHDLASQAKAIFATHPDAKYIRDDWRQPSKVLKPIINQQRAREAGINRTDIAFAMKRSSDGMPLGQMNWNDELIPIRLRADSQDMASLETLPVKSILGLHSVPLGQVVDGFELEMEQSMIWRRDRVKTITAQADVARTTTPARVRNALIDQIELSLCHRATTWSGAVSITMSTRQ